jgi:L-ascorbate metabolism protein UlaG (beta-lactamase superfamily)
VLTELGILGDLEYRNYLYTMENGTKVLIWGNKISRPDQRNILKAERPDIAIIQVTGANKAEDMAAACKEMGCKVVIPHHIDYPGDYSRQTENLKSALAEIAPEITFIHPEYNQWIEL